MVRLDPKDRAGLPDRAFAYVDSRGRRRLPIHDAAHVRNALARFSQVAFEDEQSRETARLRLLNAAKRFKIVPVGFIAGQLRSERDRSPQHELPSGFVTMLMTDIEGSTSIVHVLGPRYRELIDDLWRLLRSCVTDAGGHEVEARADEFFAVFEAPRAAVDAAIAAQHAVATPRLAGEHRGARPDRSPQRLSRRRPRTTTWAPTSTWRRGSAPAATAARSSCRRAPAKPSRRRRPTASASPDSGRTASAASRTPCPCTRSRAKGLRSRFPALRTM